MQANIYYPSKLFYDIILMQLCFSSNITSDTITLTDLIKDFSFLCTEFKSSRQKSGSSPNEVDTSLVKSQLI